MSKQTDEFYNHFSIFYPLVDVFLKSQKRKLFNEINDVPFGRLLEIGVGNGTHLQHYKQHDIFGIDTSLKMLEIAKKQKGYQADLRRMDGENILFEDCSFDYVVLSHVIAVVDDPEKVLSEVFRILKPSGKIFILNHFTPNNWLACVDYLFQPFASAFHFKSVFRINNLKAIKEFKLLQEINCGFLSYFKIFIYQKQ